MGDSLIFRDMVENGTFTFQFQDRHFASLAFDLNTALGSVVSGFPGEGLLLLRSFLVFQCLCRVVSFCMLADKS